MKYKYSILTCILCTIFLSSCRIFHPAPKVDQGTNQTTGNAENTSAIREVSAEQFSKLMLLKDVQLIDVRTPEEFKAGYIQGATLMNVQEDDFSDKIRDLDKSEPVLVYCRSGKRSMHAAQLLEKAGFEKIISLEGGILDWESQKLPIQK